MIHDRVHGTHYWDMIKDGYYRGMEQEFVRPDGMLNFYRSARTGIGQNGASFSTDLRPMAPHLADRGWALLRAAYEERDGRLVTPLAKRDKMLDTGNYSFHPLKAYAYIIEEAREAGDEEAAAGGVGRGPAAHRHEDRRPRLARGRGRLDGRPSRGSPRSLNGRKGGWLDMIHEGHARGVGDGPPGRVGALSRRDGDPRGHGRPARSTSSCAPRTAAAGTRSSCRSCDRAPSTG